MNALIGHTGFIGGHLARQRAWDACFNRDNLDAIRGRRFELLVCAGLPSDVWRANANPAGDRSNMLGLATALADVRADRFVLVSTTKVYPDPVGVDEDTRFEAGRGRAYAEHRLEFERIVARLFARCHVARLPTVFGEGMRANVLRDLVRRQGLDAIEPRSTHQWYPIGRLADDLDRVVERGLACANLCAEPVSNAAIHRAFFDDLPIGTRAVPVRHHDVRTRHGRALDGSEHYLTSADESVRAIGRWLRALGQFDATSG